MATDDDSDVPESGGVFTFGKSKFADNAPSKFWVRNDRVAEVACGDEHTALVAESGRIFTFGANDWGQLGLGDTKVRTKPSCIKSLKSEKIRAVACGRSSTYVATESGRVYSCGGNSEGQLGQGVQDTSVPKPARIEGLPDCKVKMLTAGADHAALLTEDGEVYMWGGGSEGQLGLGDVDECPTPKVLDIDEKVTCISAGYYHTALCTESGDLYTFGESENGKLGLGEDPEETNRPQKVAGISGRVNIVACGGTHTVAITSTGKVYTFGDGAHGQLGHGNIQLQATTPQEVSSLRDSKIVSAACGENHTALISDKGVLFTFGNGRHGKLGLGEENFANQFKPSAVTRFGAFTVERVACGGCHMLVLARPKLQNGEASSAESEQEEAEEVKPTKQLELLRRSDDLDLSGSFSARNRRREKQDPSASMSRTLPPLNSSISGRVLPPLSSSFTANSTENPLNKSMLPPLKKPDASSSEDRKKDSDLKETTEESTESEERKDPIKKESQDTLRAAPVPAPRFSPRLSPQPKPRILHVAEQEKMDNSEDSDDSEPKKSAIKPLKQIDTKASPIPRPRFGVKVTPPNAAGSEDDSDEDDEKKKKNDKPSFRKQKSESEDSESEDDSRKKKEADRKKETEKKKKDKSRVKKQGGLFGKKKILDSDDEDSESESEESSDKDKRNKAKKFQSNSEKKERNKKGKDKKDKKKSKVESEEEESSEEGDKKNKSNKKSKKESEEEEESSDEKEEKKNGKIKEKEKEPEPEKKPEKKTKICTLL